MYVIMRVVNSEGAVGSGVEDLVWHSGLLWGCVGVMIQNEALIGDPE